jgi:hypothetical protein
LNFQNQIKQTFVASTSRVLSHDVITECSEAGTKVAGISDPDP